MAGRFLVIGTCFKFNRKRFFVCLGRLQILNSASFAGSLANEGKRLFEKSLLKALFDFFLFLWPGGRAYRLNLQNLGLLNLGRPFGRSLAVAQSIRNVFGNGFLGRGGFVFGEGLLFGGGQKKMVFSFLKRPNLAASSFFLLRGRVCFLAGRSDFGRGFYEN